MTPEDKVWVDDLKNFYKEDVHEQTSHTLAFMNLPKAIQIIESQDKEIERLKEALQFYADKETYKRWFSQSGEEFKTYPTNASIDIGFKARQALEAK